MTIKECIDIVDSNKPNTYSIEDKVRWLSFIDEIIINDVLKTHEGYDGRYDLFEGYSADNVTIGLIVSSPYDRLYPAYLKMKIDGENGETARYNNSAALFNSYMMEYRKYYNKTHMPLSGDRPMPPAPKRRPSDGLSEEEYENLKRDLYYMLSEYNAEMLSKDKIYDIVMSFVNNNIQMLRGLNGKDGEKGEKGDKGDRGEKGDKGDAADLPIEKGIGEYSLGKGAGTKCFTITSVDKDTSGYVALTLDNLAGLEVGQECKFKINSDRYSTIRLISQGIVTLNCLWSELPSDNRELYIPDTSKGEYRDENDYYLIRNADGTDTEKNSFLIVGHPEIGTNRIIGSHTAVFGRDNKAAAEGAFVGGASNDGLGGYSATFGKENRSGFATIVAGRGNDAGSAEYGAVFGTNHTLIPNSRGVFVAGVGNTLGGSYASVVGGTGNKANAVASAILGGANNEAKGNYSVVGGYFSKANAHYQTVFGSGNIEDGNALFIIGNGNKDANGNMVRSNAFAVKKDGSIMLGNKVMLGASKGNNTLIGNTSINSAEASYSTCLGAGTKTTPFNSANPIIGSLAIGKYNAPNNDSLFMVGKGSNDANRSNAFDVKLDGTVIGGKQTTADSGDLVLVTKGYLDGLIASLQSQIDALK